MTRRVWILAAAVIAAALPATGADISGKWRAEFTSPDGQQRVNTFVFKVEGEKLTGTVAGSQDEAPILNGKIQGDEISFTADRFFGRLTYKGKVSGDQIKFTVSFDGNSFEMTAKRAAN